ncbi:YxeA family protein [Aneurinibacillus migulanus]|uniref:YxeA family protein n=1 Tax=Aneurinibacillus migulanus TaxID=47500 RepID=A0A0D1Y1W5_ANEMI|nr:YxeA family protein [Aneurinibacillus migulanus]KIV58323.1 hypothetical protein TS65_07040 [Aneurinibacillus migulanus]KON95947.1 hypothetical protein AF333_11075 [Aneurinibacillus migulanus]MED0893453.1 YxeA family protein [Aneurinibacillus migulanus]MED1618181.1 YxeA family protein [Aneurinibacillus migulanus]SDJ17756.1 conserved hypothetical protein TIGR01655 [Aneurinibacillus migulanus]
MKKWAVAALIIVILGALFIFTSRDVVDRFNPLIKQEYVYVQINKPAEPDNGRFKYKLTGYNAEGKKKNVNFTASIELPKGTYLKVLAKGFYVQKWEEVKAEDIPKEIKW